MRVRLAVSFELPEGATRKDAIAYVDDAVSTWKGSLRPPGAYGTDDMGDPMFQLDSMTVSVSSVTTRGGKRRTLRSAQ